MSLSTSANRSVKLDLPNGANDPTHNAPAPKPHSPPVRGVKISIRQAVAAAVTVVVVAAIGVTLHYRSGSERRQYDAVLRVSLDRIVTAQEGYYYDSMRYVGSLRALPTVQLPASVHVQLYSPDRRSWWGIATNDRLPGHRCIVWVGTAPATLPLEARAPENETKPLCFDDIDTGQRARRS